MTRTIRIGFSLLTVVIGWLMIGFGYSTTLGHPTSTISFLLGIGLFIGGIIAAATWDENGRTKSDDYILR